VAGTEHHTALARELRLGPDEMNLREVEAFRAQQKAAAEQQQTAAEEAQLATMPVEDQVRQQVVEQLVAANVPQATAETYATNYQAAIGTMAERFGVDPLEVYQAYGLKVVRPDLSTTDPSRTPAKVAQTAPPAGEAAPGQEIGGAGGLQAAPLDTAAPGTVPPVSPEEALDPRLSSLDVTQGEAAAAYAGEDRRGAARVDTATEDALYEASRSARAETALRFQQTSVAAQENRDMEAARLLDNNAAVGETTAENTNGPAAATQEGERAPARGAADQGGALYRPRKRRADKISRAAESYFPDVLRFSRHAGWRGDTTELKRQYDAAVEGARDLIEDLTLVHKDHSGSALLKAIRSIGGMKPYVPEFGAGVPVRRLNEEFKEIQYNLEKYHGMRGASSIFRESGGGLDRVLQDLQQVPGEWTEFGDDINLLWDAILKASGPEMDEGTVVPDIMEVLAGAYQIKPNTVWWTDPATEFNTSEFNQNLFDALLAPPMDALDTGEQQPRLPGDVGAVREQEVATPTEAAPFSLTSPIGKGANAKQTEDVSPETTTRIVRFMQQLRGMPTEYFEAKIMREVDLAEFALAVVPDNVDPKARQALEERGVHIVEYPHGDVAARKAAVEAAAADEADRVLFQDEQAAKRGSLKFGADRHMTINLFARADLSTFLHESGHFFLEVFGDLADRVGGLDPATLTADQRRGLADYQAILKFVGVQDRSELTTEHHEKFARAFEAYLMEGKAPSLALREAFVRFRAWLLGVYRALKNLNVELTDEVRGVFDRMLATDRAIAEAQARGNLGAMFTTPEMAGMSPAQFALYGKAIEAASVTARETLERKLMADVQREQTALWKEQRDAIEADVTAEVHAQPVYRAIAAMQRGTNPDGTAIEAGVDPEPVKLSRDMLIQRYGKEFLRQLPRPFIYAVEGGLDPDPLAQVFGYDTGDEMLRAIATVPPMRQAIQQETDRRMIADHGALLLDGTLHEQAQAAVANEDREYVIRAELRALGALRRKVDPFVKAERAQGQDALRQQQRERDYERRWLEAEKKLEIAIAEGRKQVEIDDLKAEIADLKASARGGAATIRAGIPPAGVLREVARDRIAQIRLRNLKPELYWSAARRAAGAARDHAARQEFDEAIAAGSQELLNLALYRAATDALEDAAARVTRAKAYAKPAARSRFGLAGEAYLDQVDGILDRYEFATVSKKTLDRRASLRKFVAALEGEGLPVDLPEELLEETRRTNYRELTYEELVGVTDGLDQIVHLANLKNRLLKHAKERDLARVTDALEASIRDNATGKVKPIERDRRVSAERKRMVADFFASHRKLASLLRELDGFKDGGPAWEAIMLPLNEAGAAEAQQHADATKALFAVVERAFPGKEKRTLYEKTYVPSVGKSLSRMERLMVGLNWGNEGNRDRIRRAEGWDEGQVQGILDTFNSNDLAFVQGILDHINSYWPQIEAKQKRVYGVAPEKVEALPIRTKAGEIPGGYFPLKYDDRLSAKAIATLDLESANLARQAAYTQATTKRNHTKERASRMKIPVRLDFGVIFEHVDQVIHDLTHHEALIDVGRVLGSGKVQQAILDVQGDLAYKQIKNAVRDVAFGDVPATNGFERALGHARSGATIAGLGWKLSVAMLQPLGLANSVVRIGPRWVAKGVTRWLRHPTTMVETVKWIEEVSPFMRSRGRTQMREINEIRNQVNVSTGRTGGWVDEALSKTTFDLVTRQGIADSYFYLIQQMQRIADVPTWLGQYEKSMAAGEPEARAFAIADQAVLDAQGGGQNKDLAAVQRGGPMLRLWTTFYSYFSVVYNQAAESKRRTRFDHPGDVARLASDYFMLFIVPATMGMLIRDALKSGGQGGDDEDAADWLKRAALENVAYISGMMLGTREIGGVISGGFGYEGPAGSRVFSAFGKLAQQVKQFNPEDPEKFLDQALARSALETAGILLHFPSGQVWATLAGTAALAEGKTTNPAAVVVGPPRGKR